MGNDDIFVYISLIIGFVAFALVAGLYLSDLGEYTTNYINQFNQNLNTTSNVIFNNLVINGNLNSANITGLLINQNKVTDLGIIWDKTTKISIGDTSISKNDLTTLLTVDASNFLLKTVKVTDLGIIWDKTTKIAYGDTDFSNQALLTTSTPTFKYLYLDSGAIGNLAELRFKNNGVSKFIWGLDNNIGANTGVAYAFMLRDVSQAKNVLTVNPSDDKIYFGDAMDTNLYRGSADSLKTDDGFTTPLMIVDTTAIFPQYILKDSGTQKWSMCSGTSGYYTPGDTGDFCIYDAGYNNMPFVLKPNSGELRLKTSRLFLSGSDYAVYSGMSTFPAFGISHNNDYTYGAMVFTSDDWDYQPCFSFVGSRTGNVLMQIKSTNGGDVVINHDLQLKNILYFGTSTDCALYRYSSGVLYTNGAFMANGNIRTLSNFYSSDGTAGVTGDYTISVGSVIHVKNGLVTGVS